MFGGPNLETLFVTTMRTTLDDAQLAEEPLAGCLLALAIYWFGYMKKRFAGPALSLE